MIPKPLILAFLIRTLLTLPFPQTYFQPDEFYQALEPAHNHVFGYGYLTWEWRDLPSPITGDWWDMYVVGGRMRGWIWPGLFVGVYKVLQISGLDGTEMITIAPRLVGILVAALTDYYTYKLASKVLSPGASASALFLSLTSLFNAHLLPRSLSTSPETLLTTMALCYFPFPALPSSSPAQDPLKLLSSDKATKEGTSEARLKKPERLDYIAMDRDVPWLPTIKCEESLFLSVVFATIALSIRPTTASLWAYLGIDLIARTLRQSGVTSTERVIAVAAISLVATFAASTFIDYSFTGRLYFPSLTFIHHNLIQNISSFYGSTNYLYHLTQSLPILLFPVWYWWIQGFAASLLPRFILPSRLRRLDTPQPLRLLARAVTFSITTLSFSPHSEWRFLHPFLPSLLIFVIPSITTTYAPKVPCLRLSQAIRQYTRLAKFPFYFVLFSPVLPFLYLNIFHGRAQVEVMNVLRRGDLGEIKSLVALTPCHSVPWQSHLHVKNMEGWFLTCEPPIGVNSDTHRTQQSFFYQSPVSYLQEVFPYPPAQLHEISNMTASPAEPSHLILFGEILGRLETHKGVSSTVSDELVHLGYERVWYGWNGFDLLQDEDERKGGLTVWRLVT
ncbi:hypothetical protein I302_103633 [Kwoniella bestiolae CBS 10118]|uniref:Mannosyltransferase n=1 Tax=Kwoniella bestiolae CBS 10118 TaxID=1296100 RepID=A0A1B9G8X7_9TREE|nr:hypothetical protein I302_02337 [Kwoniella bestiolae CBS 10118]OCF27495.1 hypothetical protein I302_02337 [Kwoniella bestiolae CBS 10118]